MKHSINGRMFGNLFGLNLTSSRDARWQVVCIPSLSLCIGRGLNPMSQQASDNVLNVHTPHWHGNTLLWAQQRVDVVGSLRKRNERDAFDLKDRSMCCPHKRGL